MSDVSPVTIENSLRLPDALQELASDIFDPEFSRLTVIEAAGSLVVAQVKFDPTREHHELTPRRLNILEWGPASLTLSSHIIGVPNAKFSSLPPDRSPCDRTCYTAGIYERDGVQGFAMDNETIRRSIFSSSEQPAPRLTAAWLPDTIKRSIASDGRDALLTNGLFGPEADWSRYFVPHKFSPAFTEALERVKACRTLAGRQVPAQPTGSHDASKV